MTKPDTRVRVYSHALLQYPLHPLRWRIGYLAVPAPEPGLIRVSPAVAEQICRDVAQLRAEVLDAVMADAEFYEDALAEVDATLPRLHLDDEHLVADWRHVEGNSDALRSTDPDPDGQYTIGLGLTWRQITLEECYSVCDDSTQPSPATAAYRAYIGWFTSPALALLDLAGRARIAVAYLDRGAIEADSRTLTDDEWELISYQLNRYDEHVSNSGELNAAFLDHIFADAGVEHSIDDEHHDAGADSDTAVQ